MHKSDSTVDEGEIVVQLKPPVPCKLCGEPSEYICSTYNEHSHPDTIDSYVCQTCGTVFVGNQVTNSDLATAYGSLDNEQYYKDVDEPTRRKFATALADISRCVSKDASLIDVGTGNGMFLDIMKEQGYTNLSAHDIPSEQTAGLAKRGFRVFQDFDYSSIPSGIFDIVTLMDIAEHVIDPKYLLSSCCRILKPGGFVYIHTPVVARLDKLMHKMAKTSSGRTLAQIWQRGRTSIFHLQNYTAGSLRQALVDAGFSDVDLRCENELSWNVSRYIEVYICDKRNVSKKIIPIAAPVLSPILKSSFLNANKGIVMARKPK